MFNDVCETWCEGPSPAVSHDDLRSELLSCPVCFDTVTDPMVASPSGITYCRCCIGRWVAVHGRLTCPLTGQRLCALAPNYVAKNLLARVRDPLQDDENKSARVCQVSKGRAAGPLQSGMVQRVPAPSTLCLLQQAIVHPRAPCWADEQDHRRFFLANQLPYCSTIKQSPVMITVQRPRTKRLPLPVILLAAGATASNNIFCSLPQELDLQQAVLDRLHADAGCSESAQQVS